MQFVILYIWLNMQFGSKQSLKTPICITLHLEPYIFFWSSLDLWDKLPSTFGENLFFFGLQSHPGTESGLEA